MRAITNPDDVDTTGIFFAKTEYDGVIMD